MGVFYIDESIHQNRGFIAIALVYSENDLNFLVTNALSNAGYDPAKCEFKSSTLMVNNKQAIHLRDIMCDVLIHNCKFGLSILPYTSRNEVLFESLICLSKILLNNPTTTPHKVYFDEGMIIRNREFKNKFNKASQKLGLSSNCSFYIEQNSKIIKGIQLADLVAHYCALILSYHMGDFKKKSKITDPESTGYPLGMEFDVGDELWGRIRPSFFMKDSKDYHDLKNQLCLFSGLHIAESCNKDLCMNALKAFEKIYYECLH